MPRDHAAGGGLLEQPWPQRCSNVLSRRGDAPFVKRFMRKFSQDSSHTVQNNLKRLESACWAAGDRQVLIELSEDEQRAAVGVAAASGMNRLEVFEIFRFLLSHGNVGGRRAAIAALSEHHGSAANQAVLDCLRDGDCQVQAAALAQLRKRGIPGAMSLLIERIDHPAPEVQRAVRDSLNEFNCGRYLAAFDMMDHNLRRNTGLLVKKIDPAATSMLRRNWRTAADPASAAIQAAAAIGVVPEVAEQILGLISDPDQVLRAEAARSLRQYDAPETRQRAPRGAVGSKRCGAGGRGRVAAVIGGLGRRGRRPMRRQRSTGWTEPADGRAAGGGQRKGGVMGLAGVLTWLGWRLALLRSRDGLDLWEGSRAGARPSTQPTSFCSLRSSSHLRSRPGCWPATSGCDKACAQQPPAFVSETGASPRIGAEQPRPAAAAGPLASARSAGATVLEPERFDGAAGRAMTPPQREQLRKIREIIFREVAGD